MRRKYGLFAAAWVCGLCFLAFAPAAMAENAARPVFRLSQKEFEATVNRRAEELHAPRWEFVADKPHASLISREYKISDRVAANVLMPKGREGITNISLSLSKYKTATYEDQLKFFLSIAAVMVTVEPGITTAEYEEILQELGIAERFPTGKTTTVKRGVTFSFGLVPTKNSAVLLVEPPAENAAPPVFKLSQKEFEATVNRRADELHAPRWEFAAENQHTSRTEREYKISDHVAANVLMPKGREGITNIFLSLSEYKTATYEDKLKFFLSVAAMMVTVDPGITPAELEDALRELDISGRFPAGKTTTIKRGVKFTFDLLPTKNSAVLLVEPAAENAAPPVFKLSQKAFEATINHEVDKLHAPRWKFVAENQHTTSTNRIYKISDRVAANVMMPKGREGITNIFLSLSEHETATYEDRLPFFLSIAAVMLTVDPGITPSDLRDVLLELGMEGIFSSGKTTTIKRGVKFTFSLVKTRNSAMLLVAPAQ